MTRIFTALSVSVVGFIIGRGFFQELPDHIRLRLVQAVPAPGVTHTCTTR